VLVTEQSPGGVTLSMNMDHASCSTFSNEWFGGRE